MYHLNMICVLDYVSFIPFLLLFHERNTWLPMLIWHKWDSITDLYFCQSISFWAIRKTKSNRAAECVGMPKSYFKQSFHYVLVIIKEGKTLQLSWKLDYIRWTYQIFVELFFEECSCISYLNIKISLVRKWFITT